MSAESMTPADRDLQVRDPRRPKWLFYTLLGVFGLLYAYAVWNAVAYMIPLVGVVSGLTTWLALVLAVILPVVLFAFALGLTRRRGLGTVALVLFAGLCVAAVFWLNVVGYTLSGAR